MTSQTSTLLLPVPAARSGTWADRPLDLLRSGIPLTLLLDLADPDGPPSELIYAQELEAG